MKARLPISALAGAALLSACAALLPPQPISDNQIAGLSPQQLQGVKQAQNRMPEAQQALTTTSRTVAEVEKEFTVAERYWDWKHLRLERAETRRELALARIEMIEKTVQAEKARAVVQAHPEMAETVTVRRYDRAVTDARSDVQSLETRIAELESLINAAHVNFQAARQKYGLNLDTPAPGGTRSRGRNSGTAPDNGGDVLQTVPLGG